MKEAFSLPNILSYIRLALVPVFVILFFNASSLYYALAIFLIASLTDAVDGFIARKFNLTTSIGKVLDPFADKLLKITVLTCFVIEGIIPVWFVIVMLALDLFLIICGSILFKREVIIQSNFIGKSGTAVIAVGILLSFFHSHVNNVNLYVLYLGLLIVFASVISYLVVYLKTKSNNKG